jgi:hypothetical protein
MNSKLLARPADDARQHAQVGASPDCVRSMNKTELVIQLLKIAIGIAFAAYFCGGAWPSLNGFPRNRS